MTESRGLLTALIIMILLAAVISALTWANYRFSLQSPGGNDFLARWMGARFWVMQGISPYDERVSLASQEMIYGHPADPAKGEDKNHFVYPLPSMLFFAPFGILDYLSARTLWMTLLEISTIALAIASLYLAEWNVRSPFKIAALVLFALLWYPSVRTIIVGQFAGLDALLMVAALLLIQRRQDTGAGILLALSTVKPQMSFLLVPFVLLWAFSVHRRQIIFGTMAGLLTMLVLSLLLLPDWPMQWIAQMMDYPSYTDRIGSIVSVIANSMPGISRPISIILYAAFIIYLLAEWAQAWGKHERWFLWTALMTLVITNFIALRTATTHFGSLLPAIFLIFMIWEDRWGKVGRWLVLLTVILQFFGLWGLFLGTVQGNQEQAIMYLPVPFFCLIGLWWVRWWAIRSPRLSFASLNDAEIA
jgi:hypothetical protein